jgi:pyruvate carboxylase
MNQDCNQIIGIQDFEYNSTVVYPNPFEKFIYLRGQINDLSIMDYSGRRIEKYFMANQSNEIVQLDLTELQSGIYFIRYFDNNGTPNFYRVIKR